jgi:hypothetical protein
MFQATNQTYLYVMFLSKGHPEIRNIRNLSANHHITLFTKHFCGDDSASTLCSTAGTSSGASSAWWRFFCPNLIEFKGEKW